MKQEVAMTLESLDFHVQTNRAFEDVEEAMSREIDVSAIQRVHHDPEQEAAVLHGGALRPDELRWRNSQLCPDQRSKAVTTQTTSRRAKPGTMRQSQNARKEWRALEDDFRTLITMTESLGCSVVSEIGIFAN
jgi:hypothetical protein